MKKSVLILMFLTACASVPRDAGIAEVEKTVGQQLNWNAQAAATLDSKEELTADKAVAIALRNNPRLQATLAELGIARADFLRASTISNPVFEAEFRIPADPFHAYEFRLAQSLIELLQLPRRRELGRLGFEAAQLRVSSEVLRFAADVRADYYDLLAATQHVAQARVASEAANAAAEVATKQHEAQNISDLDFENQQALAEQAQLELARAERNATLAREALIRSTGLRELKMPATFPALPDRELDQPQLEQLASAQRLDMQIVRREIEANEKQIPIARLAALGDIIGDIHYQRDAEGPRTWGPGIEVPIPIFGRGAAARNRAEAEWLRSKHLLNALQAESGSTLRAARATVEEARARVEYFRDVVIPRRERIVQLTTLEHNAMLAGVFQLLQSKQNEADAQRDFIEAQREYWTARIDLDRALHGVGGRS
jgi:cobalt-zinc-cadmium efflux system outer membrane protein